MPQINKAQIERILNAEKDFHTKDTEACRIAGNSRNGYGKKTLKVNFGHLELSTPRDRHSTFEPQIIPKRSTKTAILEETILSLYAKGMTIRDIQATLQTCTMRFTRLSGSHDRHVLNKTTYLALAINMESYKEPL